MSTKYEITETANDDYTVTKENEKGTINDKNPLPTATFVNTKKTTSTPDPDTGELIINKKIVGDPAGKDSKVYTFTITGPNGEKINQTITGSGSAALTDLPLGDYTITEDTADAAVAGYTLTVEGNGVTTTVEKNQTAETAIINTYTPETPGYEPPPEEPKTEDPKPTPEPKPEEPTPLPEPTPEPEPTPDPTPKAELLPDPNDPNSPKRFTVIDDEGVPLTYVKVWDPDNEEWVYVLEEDVPLADMDNTPKTDDLTRRGLWIALLIGALSAMGILLWSGSRRKLYK